jgi:hypothetical protein
MRRLFGLGVPLLVLLVLAVAQLVLPGIAAQRLRDQLATDGQVLSVNVHAFPAIELLWHHADKVVVRLGRYRVPPTQLGAKLGQSGDVGTLLASARVLDAGLLSFHDATLVKRGNRLTAAASLTEADLRSALPILSSVTPVASGDGRLTLRGTATLLGVTATVDATVGAQNGNLVVVPDVPFGGLATVTVFSDPRVRVQSVSAASTSTGFSVRGTAVLR